MKSWHAIAAACCATLLGVGLQRFAYAPLLPAMIHDGWLTPSVGGLLAAANFAGYVIGAILAPAVARRYGTARSLRWSMALATACLALCAWRVDPFWALAWMAPWRTLAGIAGGVLMVLAGPAMQGAVAPHRRGLAGGFMFSGVGGGIVVGAAIVPALLPFGVADIWLGLAAAGLLLTALSWRWWPDAPPPPRFAAVRLRGEPRRLIVAYTLAAVAATPHMAWWPDFAARGLGQGTNAGARAWLVYGLAAMAGPTICGRMADRFGSAKALRATLAAQVAGLLVALLPLAGFPLTFPLQTLSGIIAGTCAIGTTTLALTRSREVAPDAPGAIWRIGTIGWGGAQVATGFALAWLFAQTGSHEALFALGLAGAIGALAFAKAA